MVKEDFIEGKRHLWYEVTAISDEDTTTMRVLVLAAPVLDLKALRTVIKIGNGPARWLPAFLVELGAIAGFKFGLGFNPKELANSINEGLKDETKVKRWETVTMEVAGKQVQAYYMLLEAKKDKPMELWLSDEVPLISFLKMDITKAQAELIDWGYTGAVSRISD